MSKEKLTKAQRVQFSPWLPKALAARVKRMAAAEQRSANNMIVILLTEAVEGRAAITEAGRKALESEHD